jgi:hypothetical protein
MGKFLETRINQLPWTNEEDEKLINLRNEIGPHWISTSSAFKGRTDIALKNRWRYLEKMKNKMKLGGEIEEIINKEIEIENTNQLENEKNEVSKNQQLYNDIDFMNETFEIQLSHFDFINLFE